MAFTQDTATSNAVADSALPMSPVQNASTSSLAPAQGQTSTSLPIPPEALAQVEPSSNTLVLKIRQDASQREAEN